MLCGRLGKNARLWEEKERNTQREHVRDCIQRVCLCIYECRSAFAMLMREPAQVRHLFMCYRQASPRKYEEERKTPSVFLMP